ncbi:1644_t:CDS:1 [Acaulospora colombiana]|uniref:1644_t:CDS:1 n=1 Tax=Acaulospora colombiana TaxID=27376 RepID=A0ACA9P358_9GLOM|nr:1644_t:CDS:1 [Acaulospora colombiana]
MSEPPKKRPRREAPELPTHSKEFPEGYGDFIFQSTDGVVFHFPRSILVHVSPVFKDMFAGDGDSAPNQEMTVLTGDCVTLEYFLRHIDPEKETPQVEWDHVAGALQVAEKYQVNDIFKWFEGEVDLLLTSDRSFVLPNPMLYLELARRNDLQMTARISLRQLIKCPIWEITDSPHGDTALLKYIFKLRAGRMEDLVKVIYKYSELPYKHSPKCFYAKKGASGTSWRQWAIQAIVSEPSWSAVLRVLLTSCGCPPLQHTKQREEVERIEAELPKLAW